MSRAEFRMEGDTLIAEKPPNRGMMVAALGTLVLMSLVIWYVIDYVSESRTGESWAPYLLLIAAVVGIVPIGLNAIFPQRISIAPSEIALRKWNRSVRIPLNEARRIQSYSKGGDLFILIQGKGWLRISTRGYAWDAAEMKRIAIEIERVVSRHAPDARIDRPLDSFPFRLAPD